MIDFKKLDACLPKADDKAREQAVAHWNGVAKPLGSLGLLEDMVSDIAKLTGNPEVLLDKRGVLVFCADNGIVEEGVTQTGQEVTAAVAKDMALGIASVCCMAKTAGAEVFPIDIGMAADVLEVRSCKLAYGTKNFTKQPAMTVEQAEKAVQVGIDLVGELKQKGYKILATGELGIGNTTTAAALISVLCDLSPAQATGRGAGLSNDGLKRKIAAIEKGIALHSPTKEDPVRLLAALGGYDIAGMAGAFIGGALHRIPIVVDGVISAAAALVALQLCPNCKNAVFLSHTSAEPATQAALKRIGKKAVIDAQMRLGEGTGAVLLFSVLDAALSVYHSAASFEEIGMEPYKELTT